MSNDHTSVEEPFSDEEPYDKSTLEEKKPYNVIKLPLVQQQIKILKNALSDDQDVDNIINDIECIVKNTSPEELYKEILSMLMPITGEKAKYVAGMLFMYKRKPCREGNYCTKGSRCIFLHDKDLQKGNIKTYQSKRKSKFGEMQSNKRVPIKDNKEVIFNKIPADLAEEGIIAEYVQSYGEVLEIKKLNEGKYLIVFKESESAKNLIDSQESVLNNPVITKFYNVMPGKNDETLEENFVEQQEILNSIYKFCNNKDLFSKLKYICFRIQKKVEEKLMEKKTLEKEPKTTSDSLYVNQFK